MIETKKVPKNLFDLAKPSVVGRARAGLLNYRALSSDKRSPLKQLKSEFSGVWALLVHNCSRLLPRGEVSAFRVPLIVDQLGIGLLSSKRARHHI